MLVENRHRAATGFNPFAPRDSPQAATTQIIFGQLTLSQQLLGIGYLYVKEMLEQL